MATRKDLETRLIATDNASKVIERVADELDKLEKKGDTEIDLKVDGDQAEKEISDVSRKLAGLSDEDKRIVLRAQAADAQRDVDRILRSLARVDAMDHEEVRIRVEALGDARAELERIERQVHDLDNERVDVTVDADTSGVAGKLRKFRSDLSGASGIFGKVGVAGKAAFSALGPYAVEAGAVAAAAIGTFVAKAVGDFQDLALEVGHARDALGLTAEEASRLKEVGEDLGIPFATVEKAIGRMNRAAEGTPEVFEQIGAGIERSDDGALEVSETFLNVVDALDRIPDAATRAQAGQQIFGKGWAQIAELIEKGADGVREAMAEVGDAKVVTDEQINTARALRDSVDGLRDRFEEFANTVGSSVSPVLADLADGLGTVLTVTGDLFEILQGDFDIPVLNKAVRYLNPITGGFNTVTDAISGAKKEMEDFAGVTEGTVGPMASLNAEMTPMERVAMDLAAAEAQTARFTSDLYESATEAAPAVRYLAEQQAAGEESARTHAEALEREAQAALDVAEAFASAADLEVDLARATEQRDEVLSDANATTEDQIDAVTRVAELERDLLVARKTSKGQIVDETAKLDALNGSLLRQASTLKGPQRSAILGYIGDLNGIPPRKLSRIEAALAEGDIATAERILENTSRSREATITADANTATAEDELEYLARDRDMTIFPSVGDVVRRGGGGPVPSGRVALVGEMGPELVALPGGSYVYPAARTAAMVGGSTSTSTTNVTINTAVVGNEFDVQRTVRRALRGSERLNGTRRFA